MPDVKTPKFVLGRPPEEAIAFLREKKMLADKINRKQLYDSALARATTIANMTSADMLKDIYGSMEKAMREGKGFHQWKKELTAEFERKGWVYGHDKAISRGIDGTLLADPKTGEHFGTPRRLNTIYRVNMQQAYSAARYQRYMDNVDNRPYWLYSAVGDARTRPAHQALNGRVYRYDDPFWATFYPPNGFNCRCTVIALDDRTLKRRELEVGDSSEFLVEVERPKDKLGNTEKTVGFKLPDGSVRMTDKGFDYNVGRLTYRPNLDLYPEKVAHQFAKAEMRGGEFKQDYVKFEKQFYDAKKALGIEGKINDTKTLHHIEGVISQNFKFAAGVIPKSDADLMGLGTRTVWFSDESLVKQINSREGQDFGIDDYAFLPDLYFDAEHIFRLKSSDNIYKLYHFKKIDGEWFMSVTKHLISENELFMESFRRANSKEIPKMMKDNEVIK